MKSHVRQLLVCGAVALALLPFTAAAQPMQFSEVSLLVRSRESEASITRQVSQRKLAQKLTSEQEAKLKAEGASDSLLQTMRSSVSTSTAPEAAPARSQRMSDPAPAEPEMHPRTVKHRLARNDVQIIDVGVGEPVNLSEWGGVDREFVFSRRSITDLQCDNRTFQPNGMTYYRDVESDLTTDELTMVDPVGSFTHSATYLGVRAEGWEPMRASYTSIMAHDFTRPIRVQRYNPVKIPGVPYNLYPIYAAGGVSLYYVGRTSAEVVRLAVVSHWR